MTVTSIISQPIFGLNAQNQESGIPDWIQIFPAGPKLECVDGRIYTLPDPHGYVEKLNSRPVDTPIDYEHASVRVKDPKGNKTKAPAAGWLKKFEVREDGSIWGLAEWTKEAESHLEKREYRYISPAFIPIEKIIVGRLQSVALTNDPALNMPALCSSQDEENYTALTSLLGLEEHASLSAIESALLTQRLEQEKIAICSAVDSASTQYTLPAAIEEELVEFCTVVGIQKFEAFMQKLSPLLIKVPVGATQTQCLSADARRELEQPKHRNTAIDDVARQTGIDPNRLSTLIDEEKKS